MFTKKLTKTKAYLEILLLYLNNSSEEVALLLGRRSEQRTRNHHQKIFRKVWTMYVENAGQKKDEFFMTLIKLRLFLQIFLDILEFIWWSLHSSILFINIGWEVTWSHLCRKIKLFNHNQNIKPEIFKI